MQSDNIRLQSILFIHIKKIVSAMFNPNKTFNISHPFLSCHSLYCEFFSFISKNSKEFSSIFYRFKITLCSVFGTKTSLIIDFILKNMPCKRNLKKWLQLQPVRVELHLHCNWFRFDLLPCKICSRWELRSIYLIYIF